MQHSACSMGLLLLLMWQWRRWVAQSSWVCTSQGTSSGPATLRGLSSTFYRSTIESNLTICIIVSCGYFTMSCRTALWSIMRTRGKIISATLPSLGDIHSSYLIYKAPALQLIPLTFHIAISNCCPQGGDCSISGPGPAGWLPPCTASCLLVQKLHLS